MKLNSKKAATVTWGQTSNREGTENMLDPKYVLIMLLLEFFVFIFVLGFFFRFFNVGHEKNRNIFSSMFLPQLEV